MFLTGKSKAHCSALFGRLHFSTASKWVKVVSKVVNTVFQPFSVLEFRFALSDSENKSPVFRAGA